MNSGGCEGMIEKEQVNCCVAIISLYYTVLIL